MQVDYLYFLNEVLHLKHKIFSKNSDASGIADEIGIIFVNQSFAVPTYVGQDHQRYHARATSSLECMNNKEIEVAWIIQ